MNVHARHDQFIEDPNNIQAEQALLGAVLVDNNALSAVADFLQPEHFYDEWHRELFSILTKEIGAARKADPITLRPRVEGLGPIGDIQPWQYLGRLAASVPTIGNAQAYGKSILEQFERREYIRLCEVAASMAQDPATEPATIGEHLEGGVYELARKAPNERPAATIADAGQDVLEQMRAARERGEGLAGLSTGFPDLDKVTGGLQQGNLVILAGRPGMGKTALGVGIAHAVAKRGAPVVFYSLEMSRVELTRRVLGAKAGVPPSAIATGRVDSEQIASVERAERELHTLSLIIDESGGLTIPQLAAKARHWRRKGQLDLLVVDYLGLMRGTQSFGSSTNRTQEVTEITNGLKTIAKELNVPVLALSQINRAAENRENKRPMLADLRDSGSIEQDADVVLFCYREEYYVAQRKPPIADSERYADWSAELEKCAGLAEVTIAKNRHGPSDHRVDLRFDGPTMTFHSLAK